MFAMIVPPVILLHRVVWFAYSADGKGEHPVNRIEQLLPWNIGSAPAEVST